jgi:hypothetical protein
MIHCPSIWTFTSLLLRQLKVGNLSRFRLARRLEGAAGPLGAADPPLSRGMNRLHLVTLMMVLEWRLWWLIGRRGGPIDSSDHNFIHLVKLTFPWSILFIQVVHAGKEVIGTEDVARGRCGRTRQGRPCLVVRSCLAHVAHWFLPPKCVPVHKNCNTTHGILLV